MKILLTGGTGFIGSALISALNEHEVTVLSRNPAKASQTLGGSINVVASLDQFDNLDDFDAVINLAGEPIINKRWSPQQKDRICHSRWTLTQQLVDKIHASSQPPHTFISGSAVGIYGDQKDTVIDESFAISEHVNHDDFAHHVCQRWEDIAHEAENEQTRVCLLRTGIVLGKHGGALAKMLPPYQLGLGGPIGNGSQYTPWIHLQDMVDAIVFLLETPAAKGAFNLTAPEPVTNKVFSQTLAKSLHRPHIFFTPAFVLKLALGEAASLLLEGQRAIPNKLEALGYNFRYRTIDVALGDIASA
ncbi:TIGR01777 family protein [Photobacterium gaetbulicola]|uniref:Sugar nucleotide epimerase n=1 Tax=Photobacterium gaetbulicola Gung47 TaxID=658445 RepID=A0A0C5WKT1_9GAMM|nr:TIGR01777 family oxidoreductase [Photobacterium gaetbulicola]AJR07748.1 sugar nucleotide epimerase [Photobacterium gaetbulicola Gung47]PSU01109.1 TIGR01777 family protein [Photobacterium gaetbulicola]